MMSKWLIFSTQPDPSSKASVVYLACLGGARM